MKKEELLYPFRNPLMFATVMRDKDRCREFIERVIPEKRVQDIIILW